MEYAPSAIETSGLIRQVFHLALGQTEWLMTSLARLMGADIAIPEFSTLSKWCIDLPRHMLSKAIEPGSVVILDSTGFKVYGKAQHSCPAHMA